MRRLQLTWMRWAVAASIAAAGAACVHDTLDPSGEAVATVEVAPPTATVTLGASVSLTATVLDAAGNVVTGRKVRWATADSNFAVVSDAGVVTGRYVGTVPVAASVEGKTATAQVIVIPIPVATVRVSPASRDLTVGESATLTAETLDARGAVLTGRPVVWTTSRPNVATVSASGVVTAIAPGSAVITAAAEGKSGVAAVTVSPAPVASVAVTPSSASLVVGQTIAFEAEPRSASGQPLTGRVVAWSSNASQVATVSSSGLVIAVSPGTATITASSEGRSGTAQVIVAAPTVQRVEVTPATATIGAGSSFRLTATVYDTRGNVIPGAEVTWTSSDTRVATVDSDGRVRGERQGNVTITATSGSASGLARIRVEGE
jgi:trimeric autotransporter adhesin